MEPCCLVRRLSLPVLLGRSILYRFDVYIISLRTYEESSWELQGPRQSVVIKELVYSPWLIGQLNL
jgi:hypothetical protein